MSGEEDAGAWRATTDRERIEALAAATGAVPVRVRRPGGETELRLERRPDAKGVSPDEAEIPWSVFHEEFDPNRQVVRYRGGADAGGEPPAAVEVVAREAVGSEAEAGGAAGGSVADDVDRLTEEPEGVEAEQIATSDTGGDEPVVYDREETERAGPPHAADAATASTGDAAKGPGGPAGGLVVDEIRENPMGSDRRHLDEEYVVLQNEGESTIDLSGWTVENEAGRRYRFPDGFVLAPEGRVTLHSGAGEDTDDHRYWDAGEPVWDNRGDTVIVRTADGERVVRERYEA